MSDAILKQASPVLSSVVMLKAETTNGRAALIHALQPGDNALPFGVDVVNGSGITVGVVVTGSWILARGLEDKGSLFVKWGEAGAEQCRIDYVLPRQMNAER
ncbi:FimD/PapC C-terminal domain-containing protein [Paraburkholderia phenazinium]|jgi:outer membrane usher protein|uniref:Outer membrane usher protein n=1 Tax=Paraburkholderia phenazinium TaxID=60549 RepID=A0A1G7QDT7_9BURK|nr:FimD/PapC C-terminal domain-containing protein [Paraburkholderia phenazinium]SDF96664.1 outer membrane usher protein [Paraburkholderia phenazinium]